MENKTNTILAVVLTIFIMLSVFLGGYIIYDKMTSKDENSSEVNNVDSTDNITNSTNSTSSNNNSSENKTSETSENKETAKICSSLMDATYYGNYNDNIALISVTVTFRKDGTFTAEYKDSEVSEGTYTVSNNTITTKTCPSLGPCYEEIVTDYRIAADCSTIDWGDYQIYLKS